MLQRLREQRLRDLGGLLLEMYRRGSFREELLSEQCADLVAIETRLAEVDAGADDAAAARCPAANAARRSCRARASARAAAAPSAGRAAPPAAAGEETMIEPPPVENAQVNEPLEQSCPRCGAPREPDQEYCLECGLRLPATSGGLARARRGWVKRVGWYPGDWIWTTLLALVVAAGGAGVAIVSPRAARTRRTRARPTSRPARASR